MVKVLFGILLLFSFSFGAQDQNELQDEFQDEAQETLEKENKLKLKIKSFIDADVYEQNSAFIDIIFSPESDYYINDRVDSVKVIHTLKENGLLNLFFKQPSELKLSFKSSGPPLFFVKIMGDTLRNIGYYRYVTQESTLNNSEFTWTISLNAEYATDPLVLSRELSKSGCSIIDIQRNSSTDWTYIIDMREGLLNIPKLEDGVEVKLKRSLYAHWLNISNIEKLEIAGSRRNDWYPYIAYYDRSLHLLKVIKKDRKIRKIRLRIPKNAYYIKISDLYTLKNIRDALVLTPLGSR